MAVQGDSQYFRRGLEGVYSSVSSSTSVRHARAFHHALDLPMDVWEMLSQNEGPANVILPFAEKAKRFSRGDDKDQLWIALYDGTNDIEFVLSCNKGPLGDYPIFIVPSRATAVLHAHSEEYGSDLADSLRVLVQCLLNEVPPQRVFSIFSVAKVADKFAEVFLEQCYARQQYGIHSHEVPYFDATFTFCTAETLNTSLDLTFPDLASENITISLSRADMSHLEGVKALCKALHDTLPPYTLDNARAELEARIMIENKQAWVHLVQKGDEEPEIACFVGTSESDDVAVINQVFTAEHWRGRGCAARLLHFVCQEVFRTKHRIVLYVGNEMTPARRVYRKIGFQGLAEREGSQPVGVERWLEIGFKGTMLGYW